MNEFHRVDNNFELKRKKRIYENTQTNRILEFLAEIEPNDEPKMEPVVDAAVEPEMVEVPRYMRRKKEHPLKYWST